MQAPPQIERGFETRLGSIRLRGQAQGFGSRRTALVILEGVFAPQTALDALPARFKLLADVFRMRLPGASAPLLADNTLAGISTAIGEALEGAFAGRRVVLCGVSVAGVVALAVRARNIARVVALDPPLSPARMWPVHASLRATLEAHPKREFETMLAALLGRGSGDEERTPDHTWVLDRLSVPTDIMLAGAPLLPERKVARWPSLVDSTTRQRFAAHPRVRLHVAPEAGHDLLGQAPDAVAELLLEACRRGSAEHPYDIKVVDEALLEATPLAQGRVGFLGVSVDAFSAAYRSRSPASEVIDLASDGDAARGPLDVVVSERGLDAELGLELAGYIRPGGALITRRNPSYEREEALAETLRAGGLLAALPSGDTGMIARFRKPGGAPPAPTLHVHVMAFASLLMDIRTRLPAQGLASHPGLRVSYCTAPAPLPALAPETPKILVVQRPGAWTYEQSLKTLALAIAGGWVLVLEYDDHPRVIAEYHGRSLSEDAWHVFRTAHAVQTSTPPLYEAFRAYNPEVAVFENAVFELLPFPERAPPQKVFYGGLLRGDHAAAVAQSLAPAVHAFPSLSFLVIGDEKFYSALPTDRKELLGYMPYEAYLHEMSRCSISLSPLDDRPLWETKSDAKFLDAARAGVLTIASPTVYSRTIQHGTNGLLAKSPQDWAQLLIRALEEPDWGRSMARRAWELVRDRRMFAHQVDARRAWYLDLWSRRSELDEALMSRLPGLRERVLRLRSRVSA